MEVNTPSNSEIVSVAMRRIISEAWNPEVPTAIERFGITDRAGEFAATKNPGSDVHAAAGGNRLKVGVESRLVVKGLNVKREKIGIVVDARKVGVAGALDAVVGP